MRAGAGRGGRVVAAAPGGVPGARQGLEPPPPLLVGQSLELWRGALARALAGREPAPLLARARAQLRAGAEALDLNLGLRGGGEDLAWAAATLREALPGVPLFLDCGDRAALAGALRTLGSATGPLVANAVPLGAGARPLLEAAAAAGAGVVLSPAAADRAATPAPPERLVALAAEGLALARRTGVAGTLYFDCLAWPPAHDRARALRSLALARALRAAEIPLVPLLAVGNVGHGAPAALRPALRRCYAAAATAAGAGALILPLEQRALVRATALATRQAAARDAEERWLRALAAAVARGEPPTPPGTAAGDDLREAYTLLFGTSL